MLLISCKKERVVQTTPTVTEEKKSMQPKTECYTYDANGNLIELQLHYDTDSISGTLNYALADKDSNIGTFKGKLVNNVLIAEYTFQSEGMESVRQVAFQLIGDKLIEGYGDMIEEGTHFKDVTQLKFTSNMPLSKVICSE